MPVNGTQNDGMTGFSAHLNAQSQWCTVTGSKHALSLSAAGASTYSKKYFQRTIWKYISKTLKMFKLLELTQIPQTNLMIIIVR